MKSDEILRRARALEKKRERYVRDIRTRRVLSFLNAKALLISTDATERVREKIPLSDFLWVGAHVEPRVFEVLPAALHRFPSAFKMPVHMPKDLDTVMKAIAKSEAGPSFRGIPFHLIERWANANLPDRRTVPVSEKRRLKSFRFKPETLQRLSARSQELQKSETEFLEDLIRQG